MGWIADEALDFALNVAAELASAVIDRKLERHRAGEKRSSKTKAATLRHSTEEIGQFATIVDQKDFRKKIITDLLAEKNFDIKSLDVVVGRGGMLKPIPGGTYAVTDELLNDLKVGVQGQHASNLGGILAREIADSIGVPSYIVDPVVVDELMPIARYSGVPELPRTSVFHALNQKAVAKRYAKEVGKPYESLRLIVVHMGGGVSVGAHIEGKVVDVFNALDGDGAFSPERAGAVPSGALIKMCFSGKYTEKEVYGKIVGKGGFNAYLGTNDMREVTRRANDGDEKAAEAKEAFHGLCAERKSGSDHCHRRDRVWCGCDRGFEGAGRVDRAFYRISRRG